MSTASTIRDYVQLLASRDRTTPVITKKNNPPSHASAANTCSVTLIQYPAGTSALGHGRMLIEHTQRTSHP